VGLGSRPPNMLQQPGTGGCVRGRPPKGDGGGKSEFHRAGRRELSANTAVDRWTLATEIGLPIHCLAIGTRSVSPWRLLSAVLAARLQRVSHCCRAPATCLIQRPLSDRRGGSTGEGGRAVQQARPGGPRENVSCYSAAPPHQACGEQEADSKHNSDWRDGEPARLWLRRCRGCRLALRRGWCRLGGSRGRADRA